ncbi:hypothetical protein, partial [Mesorhizobium sp. M4B.F.Ca.ET.172.01.1.1]|uniref:hypothetical protein n=1 Tax=Mesorhizobium sp. M4B.F.Ca.ET.172.01.1.1 TaxID=2563950 RepID=UPI001AEEFF87
VTSFARTEALVAFLSVQAFGCAVALAPLRRSAATAGEENVDDHEQENERTARDDDEPQDGA